MRVLGYNGGLSGYLEGSHASFSSAATLVVDGEIVAACEEERFTRKKYTGVFPKNAMEYCLCAGGLKGFEDLDLIAYFHHYPLMYPDEMCNRNRERLDTGSWLVGRGWLQGMRAYNRLGGYHNGRSRRIFEKQTDFTLRSGQFSALPHHHCHAASAFYTSPFERALCVTMDAQGEATSTLALVAGGTGFEVIAEELAPNSLGYLYLFITQFIGFERFEEYKVMGLAPYGNPATYRDYFRHLIRSRPDGSYDARPELISYLMARDALLPDGKLFPRSMVDALGEPRRAGEPVTQRHMDIAAGLQEALEETVLEMLRHLRARSGEGNLCLAGGVALNSTLNGKIARSGLFDDVWVDPAAHDAGTSAGAALYGYHNVLLRPREIDTARTVVYLGPEYDSARVEDAVAEREREVEASRPASLYEEVARAIADGAVVAWFQGRSEWGQRALGNRSILADPRRDGMKDIVNHAVKKREGFRPFAPACLASEASDWFDTSGLRQSGHMLYVVPVHANKRDQIPAVTHVDGSARLQTVSADDNPGLHGLLRAFFELTGVPVLLNTSFNIAGEPIVNSPADALGCFLSTEIDLLVIDGAVVRKKSAPREAGARSFTPSQTGRLSDGQIMGV